MHIVQECSTKSEAFQLQCRLQKQYGFKTDQEKCSINASKATQVTLKRGTHNFLGQNRKKKK